MGKIIGVDLDSTLIKMTVCGKAAKKLGYDYTDKDVIDWYQSNFPEDMKNLIFEMFQDPDMMCEDVEPIEGSQDKIKEWTDAGHKIVLITARGDVLKESTIKFINLLYPEIEDINFVGFNESKLDTLVQKNVQIYIDDAVHNVMDSISLNIPTILISNKFTKYNWEFRDNPKLHAVVKTLGEISNELIG